MQSCEVCWVLWTNHDWAARVGTLAWSPKGNHTLTSSRSFPVFWWQTVDSPWSGAFSWFTREPYLLQVTPLVFRKHILLKYSLPNPPRTHYHILCTKMLLFFFEISSFYFFKIVFIYLFDKEFFTPQCRGQKQKLEMYKVCACGRNRKWKRKSRQSWGNKSTYTDSADILLCFFSCTSWCRILYKFYLHVV